DRVARCIGSLAQRRGEGAQLARRQSREEVESAQMQYDVDSLEHIRLVGMAMSPIMLQVAGDGEPLGHLDAAQQVWIEGCREEAARQHVVIDEGRARRLLERGQLAAE